MGLPSIGMAVFRCGGSPVFAFRRRAGGNPRSKVRAVPPRLIHQRTVTAGLARRHPIKLAVELAMPNTEFRVQPGRPVEPETPAIRDRTCRKGMASGMPTCEKLSSAPPGTCFKDTVKSRASGRSGSSSVSAWRIISLATSSRTVRSGMGQSVWSPPAEAGHSCDV